MSYCRRKALPFVSLGQLACVPNTSVNWSAQQVYEEDQMPSILNEALEWLDRAEQAREVAGQLTDPSARKAVLELAQNFDRLARAAAAPTAARRRVLAMKDQ